MQDTVTVASQILFALYEEQALIHHTQLQGEDNGGRFVATIF